MIQIPVEKKQEAYTWYADYTDDRPGLHEVAAHNFAEVDQSRVKALYLLPCKGGAAHRVDIPQGATPVFFRRHPLEIDVMQSIGVWHSTVHCIGWRKGDEATYLFIFDDGSTLLSNDLQAV